MKSEALTSGRAQHRSAQRQKILHSAREVFFRDGFAQANLDEVAAHAGVAKGTLYRYFENKADLYVALLTENGRGFESRMREAAARGGTASDRIRALGRFYYEHWRRHWEYFPIFWAMDNQHLIGHLPEDMVQQVKALWRDCLHILADVVRGGVRRGELIPCDPWEVANILWTVANSALQTELNELGRDIRGRPLQSFFEDAVECVVRGLEVPDLPTTVSAAQSAISSPASHTPVAG